MIHRRQEFRTGRKSSSELIQRNPVSVNVGKIWQSLKDNGSAITSVVAILGLGGSFVAFVASIATGISADIKSLETTMSADNKSPIIIMGA